MTSIQLYRTQEEWDQFNQLMSDILQIEYKHTNFEPTHIKTERISFSRIGIEPWNKGKPSPNKGKKREGFTPWNKGKSRPEFTQEHKEKLRISATGRVLSEESKKKMSVSRKGVKKSEEWKSNSLMNTQLKCVHCGKIGQSLNMKRYHFDNCKLFTDTI
jgi:hypothetical protein